MRIRVFSAACLAFVTLLAWDRVFAGEANPPQVDGSFGLGTTYVPPSNPVNDNDMRSLFEGVVNRAKEITPEQMAPLRDASGKAIAKAYGSVQSKQMSDFFGDTDLQGYARMFLAQEFRDEKRGMSLNGNPVIFMFISSSIPVSTLKAYSEAMRNVPNTVVFVLRGFVGGMKLLRPTTDFLRSWSGWEYGQPSTFGLIIDPMLFGKYKVQNVPTLVYDPAAVPQDYSGLFGNEETVGRIGEGSPLHGPVPDDSYLSVTGDVAMDYSIELINREVKSPYLAYLLDRMRGDSQGNATGSPSNTFYGGGGQKKK